MLMFSTPGIFDPDLHDIGYVPEMMGRNLRMSFPSGLAELDLRTNTTVSWRWLMVLKIASLAALELCEMIAPCGGGCFMGIKWRAKCAEVQGINT